MKINEQRSQIKAKSLSQWLKNSSIYSIGDLSMKALSAIFLPLLTFYLTPSSLGVWSLSMTILTGLTTIFNLALHGAATRFFYDYDLEHDRDQFNDFMGTLLSWLLIWSSCLSVLFLLVGPFILESVLPQFPFWPYGACIIIMAFLGVLGSIPKALWAAAEKPKLFVSVSALGSGLDLLGSLFFVIGLRLDIAGLFLGKMISLTILAVVFLSYSIRSIGLAWHISHLKSALKFSLPLVPHLLAHWVLAMVDRLMIESYFSRADVSHSHIVGNIGKNTGLHAVGIYAVGYTFINILNTITVAVNRAWIPKFNRFYADESSRPFIAKSITYFLLVILAVGTTFSLFSPLIVKGFFASDYHQAAELTTVLCIGGIFQGMYFIYVAGIFYHKNTTLIPWVTMLSGLVNLGLNAWWIPRYGLIGAAWATVVGYACLCWGARWACRRFTYLPFESRAQKLVIGLSFIVIVDACMMGVYDTNDSLMYQGLVKLFLWLTAAGVVYYVLRKTP